RSNRTAPPRAQGPDRRRSPTPVRDRGSRKGDRADARAAGSADLPPTRAHSQLSPSGAADRLRDGFAPDGPQSPRSGARRTEAAVSIARDPRLQVRQAARSRFDSLSEIDQPDARSCAVPPPFHPTEEGSSLVH